MESFIEIFGFIIGIMSFLFFAVVYYPELIHIIGFVWGMILSVFLLGFFVWILIYHPQFMDIIGILICNGIECYLYHSV